MPYRLLLALACLATLLRAAPEYPKMGPDIYDPHADGSAQIAAALTQAKAEHKHVLLKLGANWCIWCRRLHATLADNPEVRAALGKDYVLVQVDVNQRNGTKRNAAVNEKYGNPIQHGLPVLVVLDADGKQLATQETGALEDGKSGHDPAKLTAFLGKWAPKR